MTSSLIPHHLVPVDVVASRLQLTAEPHLPIRIIERDVNDAVEVGGPLDIAFDECGYSVGTKRANKETKLENDILSSARTQVSCFFGLAYIVGRHQYDRKAYTRRFLAEFRDYRAAFVRPLVKDDRVETKSF